MTDQDRMLKFLLSLCASAVFGNIVGLVRRCWNEELGGQSGFSVIDGHCQQAGNVLVYRCLGPFSSSHAWLSTEMSWGICSAHTICNILIMILTTTLGEKDHGKFSSYKTKRTGKEQSQENVGYTATHQSFPEWAYDGYEVS